MCVSKYWPLDVWAYVWRSRNNIQRQFFLPPSDWVSDSGPQAALACRLPSGSLVDPHQGKCFSKKVQITWKQEQVSWTICAMLPWLQRHLIIAHHFRSSHCLNASHQVGWAQRLDMIIPKAFKFKFKWNDVSHSCQLCWCLSFVLPNPQVSYSYLCQYFQVMSNCYEHQGLRDISYYLKMGRDIPLVLNFSNKT